MTKNDILLLSEIYDRTRREQPGDFEATPSKSNDMGANMKLMDLITSSIDTLVQEFLEDSRIEKMITSNYGSGYADDIEKIKHHIEGLTDIWENLRYETDQGHDV